MRAALGAQRVCGLRGLSASFPAGYPHRLQLAHTRQVERACAFALVAVR